MMIDVDTLTRSVGPLILLHCTIAYILHGVDVKNRPDAYKIESFSKQGKTKVDVLNESHIVPPPIITQTMVNSSYYITVIGTRTIVHKPQILTISSCPVLVTSASLITNNMRNTKETTFRILNV